jgi:hypothetical protein
MVGEEIKMKGIWPILVLAAFWSVLSISGQTGEKDRLIVHEWGVFTSIQDEDGVRIEKGLRKACLRYPGFCYKLEREKKSVQFRKPVIYLYTRKRQKVEVQAEIPDGFFSRWYPWACEVGPRWQRFQKAEDLHDGYLVWRITVIPADRTNRLKKIPAASSWWAHLRDTDSANVMVKPLRRRREYEKFIFYTGSTDITCPLKVTLKGHKLVLRTLGKVLKHAWVINSNGKKGAIDYLGPLKNGVVDLPCQLEDVKELIPRVCTQLKKRLIQEGYIQRRPRVWLKYGRSSSSGPKGYA